MIETRADDEISTRRGPAPWGKHMKRVFWALLLAVAAFAAWWTWGRPPSLVNAPPPPGPIVAFGDSLTAGEGVSPDAAYPARLAAIVGRPVINAGRPGDTVEQAAARLDADVLAKRPAMAIVLLGGNDYLQRKSLDEAFARLEDIVHRIQASGAMVVLVGIEGFIPFDGIEGRYKALARRTGALFVPNVLDGILGDPKRMSDQVHPNAAGYQLMAERVAQAIRPWLSPAAGR
jgi:lysophospholipase L1-like esterase